MEGSCSKNIPKIQYIGVQDCLSTKTKDCWNLGSSSSSVLPCRFLLPKPLTVTKAFRLHVGHPAMYKAWIWCGKQFLSAKPNIHSYIPIKALFQQPAMSLANKRLNQCSKEWSLPIVLPSTEILPESSLTRIGPSDTWLHLPRGPVCVRKRREELFTKDWGGGWGSGASGPSCCSWLDLPRRRLQRRCGKGVVLSFAGLFSRSSLPPSPSPLPDASCVFCAPCVTCGGGVGGDGGGDGVAASDGTFWLQGNEGRQGT